MVMFSSETSAPAVEHGRIRKLLTTTSGVGSFQLYAKASWCRRELSFALFLIYGQNWPFLEQYLH